jgi:hypothetical protein
MTLSFTRMGDATRPSRFGLIFCDELLSSHDTLFYQDGRCYSPQLFGWTETVLLKIGRADLAAGLQEIAVKVIHKVFHQITDPDLDPDPFVIFFCTAFYITKQVTLKPRYGTCRN